MAVPLCAWVAVLAVILAMLTVDLFAHRTAHVVSVKEAAVWSAIWVSLGLMFADRELRVGPLPVRGFLVFTGWKMFTHRNDEMDPSANPVLRWVRKRVPNIDEYHGQKFWVNKAGTWVATPLFTVLVLVETSDIIFPVDSIPAIFAITQDPFLVFTSNAFAILGLRAMYFLLADLIHRFIYLKAGLAAILDFVGIKMLLLDVYKVPIWLSLAVIAACITVAVVASLRATSDQAEPQPSAIHSGPDTTAAAHPVHGATGESREVEETEVEGQ